MTTTVRDLLEPILKQADYYFDPNSTNEEIELICAPIALGVLLNNTMKVFFDKSYLNDRELVKELELYTDALRDVVSRNPKVAAFIRDEIDRDRAYNSFLDGLRETMPRKLIKKVPKIMPYFCRVALESIFHPAPATEKDVEDIYEQSRKRQIFC